MPNRPQPHPPQDVFSPELCIAHGCTHGKCRFCSVYHGATFEAVPLDEVVAQIEDLTRTATALTRRLYLTEGNPFCLPTERLLEIFDAVERRIPSVSSYGGFCRIADIAAKSDEELAALAARGVDNITIGAESGDDEVLAFMCKGHTAADVVEQGRRMHAAGMRFSYFYLAGLAGAGRGQDNAVASARAFSEAGPDSIIVMTMTPTRTWPLAEDIEAGRWRLSGELEAVREVRAFVENLTCKSKVVCSHDSDLVRFEGLVPNRQAQMLELIDEQLPKLDEGASRKMREMLILGPRSA